MTRLTQRWTGSDRADAPILVLLHGYTDDGRCWTDAVAHWGEHFRIATPDALGHGTSPRFTDEELMPDPTVAMYETTLELVRDVVRENGPVVLLGHSMGGALAGLVATRHPELVLAVVLEDPAWGLDPQSRRSPDAVAEQLRREYGDEVETRIAEARADGWPENELADWARAKLDLDPRFAAGAQIVPNDSWTDVVAALAVPTLIVTGDHESILDTERLETIARIAPVVVKTAVVPRSRHNVRRENGRDYYATVDRFLAPILT